MITQAQTFRGILLSISNPMIGTIVGMCESKKFIKEFFITDESRYKKIEVDFKPLVEKKYLSLSRRGKKATIKILVKAKEEILN